MLLKVKARNNNDLTIRDRLSRLEGRVGVLQGLNVGIFLGVMALVLAQAFG